MTEPCDLPATTLRQLIGNRQLSPRELFESCVRRIELVNPSLNAMTSMDLDVAAEDAARKEAATMRGEALGPLHGLPIGIKDLQNTAGLRTTFGSPLFRDHVPDQDDRIVASVRAAGAVVLGKTNVPEWGAGANSSNPVTGVSGNPFDPVRTPGGSSGGSAAALATGMVPLATGSDTGGSLRNPASFCGVVGFRPSQGVVPAERKALAWSPISVLGPMGRNVADACLLLSVIAGDDGRDPFTSPLDPLAFRDPGPIDLASLRVATSEDLGFAPISRQIRDVFRERVDRMAPVFASCEPLTPWFDGADLTFETIRAAMFLAQFGDFYRRTPEQLGPHIIANVEQGLAMSIADYAAAHQRQTEIYRRFQTFFEDIDLLICPAASVSPFPSEISYPTEVDGVPGRTYFHWLAINYGLTLTTHPVAVIPCGRDGEGLPFGIQIVGPRRSDRHVLAAARELERVFADDPKLARPIPNLAGIA